MKLEEELKQKQFKSEHQKAVLNILFTGHWLDSENTKILKPYGISPQQYNVLRILKGQHPNAISVNNIMGRMIDKMSNTSRLVEKLRQKEFIERVICEHDRRQVDVKITDKGIKLLEKLTSKMDDFDQIINKITIGEAKLINTILDKVRK
ncbi:MAG: MarR family transcriptional regulator [Flavobacteriales bacterium CG_4_9_14_3_um_filter_32_8]|nr:MAG: MarR family transcriptional regulator [Flavobacteriales bacterium CG_4_9_14_3_um_filter_32_8]